MIARSLKALHSGTGSKTRIARYLLAGGTGAILQFLVFWFLTGVFSMHYLAATTTAFIVSLVYSFTMQKLWTFKDSSTEGLRRQTILYSLVAVGGVVANVFLMYIFIEKIGMAELIAQAITITIIAWTSYFVNNAVTFKEVHEAIRESIKESVAAPETEIS